MAAYKTHTTVKQTENGLVRKQARCEAEKMDCPVEARTGIKTPHFKSKEEATQYLERMAFKDDAVTAAVGEINTIRPGLHARVILDRHGEATMQFAQWVGPNTPPAGEGPSEEDYKRPAYKVTQTMLKQGGWQIGHRDGLASEAINDIIKNYKEKDVAGRLVDEHTAWEEIATEKIPGYHTFPFTANPGNMRDENIITSHGAQDALNDYHAFQAQDPVFAEATKWIEITQIHDTTGLGKENGDGIISLHIVDKSPDGKTIRSIQDTRITLTDKQRIIIGATPGTHLAKASDAHRAAYFQTEGAIIEALPEDIGKRWFNRDQTHQLNYHNPYEQEES